jgi:membrane protein
MKKIQIEQATLKFFKETLPDVVKDTAAQMKQAQLFQVASSLAYTTVLSIIPVLAVSFAVFQAFGGLQKIYGMIKPLILSNLAQGASEDVIATLQKFIENAHAGALGVGGFLGLVVTSMMMLSNAENAINQVWQVKNTRKLFQRISYYWLIITLGPLALSVAVGVATSFNLPLTKLLPTGTGSLLITVGIFYTIYKWVPEAKVKWQFALLSSIVTAILWHLARLSYVWYNKHVVTYNVVYGSLGAVPILLVWIYIAWLIILSGAALTAALQKRVRI